MNPFCAFCWAIAIFCLWHSKWFSVFFCAYSLIVFQCKLYLVLLDGLSGHFPPEFSLNFSFANFGEFLQWISLLVSWPVCLSLCVCFVWRRFYEDKKLSGSASEWPMSDGRWLICDYQPVANGADGLEPIWALLAWAMWEYSGRIGQSLFCCSCNNCLLAAMDLNCYRLQLRNNYKRAWCERRGESIQFMKRNVLSRLPKIKPGSSINTHFW